MEYGSSIKPGSTSSVSNAVCEAYQAYQHWCNICDGIDADDIAAMRCAIAEMTEPPVFHVLLFAADICSPFTERSIASLDAQVYRRFTFQVHAPPERGLESDDAVSSLDPELAALNAALNGPLADMWLLFLYAGDALAPHALYWFAHEISHSANRVVIYSDDDELDAAGCRIQPRFKPDWSLTHLHSTDFIGNAAVFSAALIARAGGIDVAVSRYGPYELLLRMLDSVPEGDITVSHVPAVLLHRRLLLLASAERSAWQRQALEGHFQRLGRQVEIYSTQPGICHVHHAVPQPVPKVSIIIPTRDEPAMLRRCIESLLRRTCYPEVEILVMNNQSRDPVALAYLTSLSLQQDNGWHIRVLHYDRAFNYSDINNRAAREARGDLLCLLNNDTEVIACDWLEEMVGHLLQPGVGVVGAKLLYPDGRVQHAGDVVGRGGCANHLHSRIEQDDPGYCNRAIVAQELSAVTAACLLTRRDLYLRLGGLNKKNLPIAFNDVDYCLRVREAGYKVVWTPHAVLSHHESVSRGKVKSLWRKLQAKRESRYMRNRWHEVMQNDPFYNPNLSSKRPDFSLSQLARVKRPW